MAKNAVEVQNLTKSYGKSRGIVDLDFEVKEGEVFGFLGPNGAGKTTTIRVLLDFLQADKGTGSIFDLDIHKDRYKVKELVGYLPGELRLYENLTGKDHLDYLASLRGGVDATYLESLVNRLNANLHSQIKHLSTGNKQKLGLIQAFMHKPKLLILDEPTSGLDPLVQHEFTHLVKEAKESGATLFVSSHILPEMEKISDRVGIIRDGRMVTLESIEKLRNKAVRELEITFKDRIDLEKFVNLKGIKDSVVEGNTFRCKVVGDVDAVIKEAAKHHILNIISREPDLEEVFMSYYEEQNA